MTSLNEIQERELEEFSRHLSLEFQNSREGKGYSIETTSSLSGVSEGAIRDIELSPKAIFLSVSINDLKKIASIIDVDLDNVGSTWDETLGDLVLAYSQLSDLREDQAASLSWDVDFLLSLGIGGWCELPLAAIVDIAYVIGTSPVMLCQSAINYGVTDFK